LDVVQARLTMNVSLSDEATIEGGELVVLAEGYALTTKRLLLKLFFISKS
jgi:hypothetical protein